MCKWDVPHYVLLYVLHSSHILDVLELLAVTSPSIFDDVSMMFGVLCVSVMSVVSMICVCVSFSCAVNIRC